MAGQRLKNLTDDSTAALLPATLLLAAMLWLAPPVATATGEPQAAPGPRLVMASDMAPIPGLLHGGRFRLELAGADLRQGRLELVLEPDFAAIFSPEAQGEQTQPSRQNQAAQSGQPGQTSQAGQAGQSGQAIPSFRPAGPAGKPQPGYPHRLHLEITGLISPGLDAVEQARATLRLEFANQPDLHLGADFNGRRDPAAPANLQAAMVLDPITFPAAQALTSLLPGWPPLLSLEKGEVSLELNFHYRDGQPGGSGHLGLEHGEGIYNTAFFRGLSLAAPFSLDDDFFQAEITAEVAEFNPGIAIRPVRVALAYQAPRAAPGQGLLQIRRLEAELLGGRVRAQPLTISLATTAGQLLLQVEGLDLARLLETHPVEGLTGSGLIDGLLPLHWGPDGPGMRDGHLQARPPGGSLRYDSAAATALALRNPAVKLVLDALANFHYNVLSAGLNYREDGTLNLALRLEGSNPAFERGRPIHLDLNLEENIPALLASLQLGNRISDTIRQRIEEQYR